MKGNLNARFLVNFKFTILIVEIKDQLHDAREQLHEHQAHLKALENGETFVPTLKKSRLPVNGKKRKSTGKIKQGPTKRRRSVPSDADEEDELMESNEDFTDYSGDDDSDMDEDDDDDSVDDDDDDDDRDHENAKASGEEEPDSSEVEDEEITDLTESDLKEKIQEAKDAIKVGRDMLKNAETAKKEAIDALSSVEKGRVKIQREKNAFCSLKRSEVGRKLLQFLRQ